MMRLTLALAVALLLIVACGGSAPEESATPTPTPLERALARFYNSYDPYKSATVIITLDFQTLGLKAAYLVWQGSCDTGSAATDEQLGRTFGDFFSARGYDWARRLLEADTSQGNVWGFEISRVGDFVVLLNTPSDYGGVAVCDRCSGAVLFAGSIIWNGLGRQLYPAEPIPSYALQRAPGEAAPPERIDLAGYGGDEEGGLAAWDSVLDLNLVKELASAPYNVLVYLYPRTVGTFDPLTADWVILLRRSPTE
jgi:hypothetical protein